METVSKTEVVEIDTPPEGGGGGRERGGGEGQREERGDMVYW